MQRTFASVVLPLLILGACKAAEKPQAVAEREALPTPEPEPAFTTPCAGTGYSRDVSEAGLAVRDAPRADAQVLGRLYTILYPSEPGEDGPGIEPTYGQPDFRIIAISGDWIRIEGADPVSEGLGSRKANFTGRGWIPRAMVGYVLSGPERPGRTDYAYAAPDFAAQVTDAYGGLNVIHVPSEPMMTTCKGSWIELRYRKRLPQPENAPPPRDPYGDGAWVTGWIKVEPYVTYQR